MRVTAPAKVNVSLYITGKRDDGYHLLETLVIFPDIGDTLQFEASDLLTLNVQGDFAALAGNGPENLVLRAARALSAHTRTQHGARITLTKNLPVGAGIGGGSSDAAATLKALNTFWQLGLSMDDLHEIAETLGADVPMCLYAQPLYALGVGERIEFANYTKDGFWILLVYPGFAIVTKDVFAAIDEHLYRHFLLETRIWGRGGHVQEMSNHLTIPALQVEPRLDEVFWIMANAAAPNGSDEGEVYAMRLSGSGSCVYILYDNEAAAAACAARITQERPEWWVRTAPVKVGS